MIFAKLRTAGDFLGGLVGGGQDVRPIVIADVKTLADRGVRTYVISLAGDDQMLMMHLTDVASAGNTGKPPFAPRSTAELQSALESIVMDGALCSVHLQSRVELAHACEGSVEIAGAQLKCDAADGFKLEDASTLLLMGSACSQYRNDRKSLKVDFPCEALQAP
jgi:hypothetical protein